MKHLKGIRDIYSQIGVQNYYQFNKADYHNPHTEFIHTSLDWVKDQIEIGSFLDLSCGDGVVSSYLKDGGFTNFFGTDPYFCDIYSKKLGTECFQLSFEEIAKSGLPKSVDTIISSYALHLCPTSFLNTLLYQLAKNCKYLVIISPNKNPEVKNYFEEVSAAKFGKSNCRILKSLL